ncbi:hypothetical protein N0O92_14290 [Alkalihalobacillus sp. MEB130]|uniref:hypothetical protein n=1 Tax=Alkalihalobacillus sp. MEB130 TaxID=2976704 RepID=UPI0028E03398|nr:hypothetical protein [Alkalihalobacillus sp. MEB130]MDT8861387.1 hypothetical protein [Alkalihalobacillus sp. MEB130]
MSDILYDLFLVVFGIILGVIVSDPLKKLYTGKYKEEARQKKRVKLLLQIRENQPKEPFTTEALTEKVFSGKLDVETVYTLLKEIEEFGLIKGMEGKEREIANMKWVYVKKS